MHKDLMTNKMKKELIPIIASYWGAECSYETYLPGRENITLDALAIRHIETDAVPFFKLHLRPLWSITEEELRELGKALFGDLYSIEYSNKAKVISQIIPDQEEENVADWPEMDIVEITNALFFTECTSTNETIQIINHLRAKGFCVDQALVDAGLVEWKEN